MARTQVEQAFRVLKSDDLQIRPICHRLEKRVRAHIFLCMLTYSVEYEMRKRLAPLLFADQEVDETRDERDPVAPAEPSKSARNKRSGRKTPEGLPVQSFGSLLKQLGKRARVTLLYKTNGGGKKGEEGNSNSVKNPTAIQYTSTPFQQEAFRLLGIDCAQ